MVVVVDETNVDSGNYILILTILFLIPEETTLSLNIIGNGVSRYVFLNTKLQLCVNIVCMGLLWFTINICRTNMFVNYMCLYCVMLRRLRGVIFLYAK